MGFDHMNLLHPNSILFQPKSEHKVLYLCNCMNTFSANIEEYSLVIIVLVVDIGSIRNEQIHHIRWVLLAFCQGCEVERRLLGLFIAAVDDRWVGLQYALYFIDMAKWVRKYPCLILAIKLDSWWAVGSIILADYII